jgi:hypothetical protein
VTIEPKLMSEEWLNAIRGDFETFTGELTPRPYTQGLLAHIAALDLTVASLTEELRTSQSSWFAERAEAVKTVECLKEQLAEVAGVVGEIEARTVEAIAAMLERDATSPGDIANRYHMRLALAAADIRCGAWRTK